MGNRSFIAQVAVFVLVGVNVAAYYVFWPRTGNGSPEETKANGQDQFVQSISGEKKSPAVPAPPADFPAPADPASVPSLPAPPVSPPAMPPAMPPAKDPIVELLTRIQKESASAPKLLDISALPPLTDQGPSEPMKPRELPPLQAEPVPLPAPLPAPIPAPIPPEGKSPPLAQDVNFAACMQKSPWMFKLEIVGTQTQLIAQVKPSAALRPGPEFKILCDRVEMKAPDGALQAVGKVTFVGAGLTGSCQRLTLPFSDVRIIFEENVRFSYDAGPPSCVMRSESFVWEMPGPPSSEPRPVTFGSPPRAILDGPASRTP